MMVNINMASKPMINKYSAIFSYLGPRLVVLRIDKKESILLTINKREAIAVNSSIIDFAPRF